MQPGDHTPNYTSLTDVTDAAMVSSVIPLLHIVSGYTACAMC
jgi:hypothetical protein